MPVINFIGQHPQRHNASEQPGHEWMIRCEVRGRPAVVPTSATACSIRRQGLVPKRVAGIAATFCRISAAISSRSVKRLLPRLVPDLVGEPVDQASRFSWRPRTWRAGGEGIEKSRII
jgi:hypothetical protein